jgi:acyl dehydratase
MVVVLAEGESIGKGGEHGYLTIRRLCWAEGVKPFMGKTHCFNWFHVSHRQIDAFARATGDEQWIHRGDAGPAGSPFGEPIAPGLLLVSVGISLARDCGALPDATLVLYGLDNFGFADRCDAARASGA